MPFPESHALTGATPRELRVLAMSLPRPQIGTIPGQERIMTEPNAEDHAVETLGALGARPGGELSRR